MKRHAFQAWLSQLPTLTRAQKVHVRAALGTREPVVPKTLQWLVTLPTPGCPHCQAERPYRWGYPAGAPRYRCRHCRRTFSAFTGTPVARLRDQDRWLTYRAALQDGWTVRQAAQRGGIHKNTSFRWRHRFLTRPADCQADPLHGIVEADDTYCPDSCTGQRPLRRPPRQRGRPMPARGTGAEPVPVLVVRDRVGATADFQLTASNAQAHDLPPPAPAPGHHPR